MKLVNMMIKHPKDFTWKDFKEYIHRRACDGNWSEYMAIHFIKCYRCAPRFGKKKWFNKNKHLIFNLNINVTINIETGEITEVLNNE